MIAGRTYLITRRCTQRQFLLRPDEEVSHIFEYCLAEAADRFRVTLYGWMAMSNHEHLVARDNEGNLPDFLAHLHKMIAKALNTKWGRSENLWAAEQPNVVHLVEPQDRFDKLIYLLANPVQDDLVDRVACWPGASSYAQHLGSSPKTIARPRRYFRKDGPMPETVTLRAERLDGYEHLDDAAWISTIAAAVTAVERRARETRAEARRGVVGRKAVLRARHTDRAASPERRRGLRPQVACRDPKKRARELALLRGFRVAHGHALRRWIGGDHHVVFPPGTFRMRRLGAVCEMSRCPPPAEAPAAPD